MHLMDLYSNVTGGETISMILFLLFIVVSSWLTVKLVRNFKQKVTTLKLFLGTISFLIISLLLSDSIIGLLFFPGGEYMNFGALKGVGLLVLSIFTGIAFGFTLIKKLYFTRVIQK